MAAVTTLLTLRAALTLSVPGVATAASKLTEMTDVIDNMGSPPL
jgi:hypothetical protein